MESRRVFVRGSQGITKGHMGVGNHLLDPAISVEGPCKMREATFILYILDSYSISFGRMVSIITSVNISIYIYTDYIFYMCSETSTSIYPFNKIILYIYMLHAHIIYSYQV